MNARRVRDIEYQLLPGTDRKTTDIVIERNGSVVVRPPKSLSAEHVDAVVESKRIWIYRNLAEWRDLNATAVVREWVNGETFLYLGRTYRLSLVPNQSQPLKLENGRFCLDRRLIDKHGPVAAKKAFELYYAQRAYFRIKERVRFFAPKVGVTPTGIQVGDIGYKWGACTQSGLLTFHWKCMMATPKVMDYIVVHELCHIHQANHTDAFWNEVDKVMPDYGERKDWLRKNGAGLDL